MYIEESKLSTVEIGKIDKIRHMNNPRPFVHFRLPYTKMYAQLFQKNAEIEIMFLRGISVI